MRLRGTTLRLNQEPRILFLVDGAGALLSAFMLGVVLVRWQEFFGIPIASLYLLATWPIFFAVYDFFAFSRPKNTGTMLIGIAGLNLTYCFLSIIVALYHNDSITIWGWTYLFVEIIIVSILAIIEFRTGRKITQLN